MVSRIEWNETRNLETELTHYDKIYSVESEEYDGLFYGLSDGKFAVLRPDGAVFCPVHETPKLARRMLPRIREEIMGVYKDIKDLGLERVWRS